MMEKILEAVQIKLFSEPKLTNVVGTRIAYGRGPVSSEWPQITFFEVAQTKGYQVDFDTMTIQFSIWALDKFTPAKLKNEIMILFQRLKEDIQTPVSGGFARFTWSEIIDVSALPIEDPQLYGQQVRVLFRYRGRNIGG